MPETGFPYVVVDVFTRDRFGGNQLAVITDARGLSDRQMQQIAAEFNFAETSFVLPPEAEGNTARVRIFTRMHEVPFAGHPNVGTAYVLGRLGGVFGRPPGRRMRFEEAAGLVEVDILDEDGAVVGATITAPRRLEVGPQIEPAVVAACVGLDRADVLVANHAPVRVSVGLPFVVAELRPEALSRARPQLDCFRDAAARPGHTDLTGRFSVYVYSRLDVGPARLGARMFAPLSGNFEDPATGSAAAALGAFLATSDPRPEGRIEITVEQGVAAGRPSEILLAVRKAAGEVDLVEVSGRCVQTMRGVLTLA